MHRLLQRQLRKHLGIEGDVPENLQAFVDAVDQAYQQFDDDRRLMERAMTLSSAELTEKNNKLKELVNLAEEAQRNLRRARDEAEAANRHKSEFLANMSHEIRTPLNAIIGMSNLLIELDQTEQQRDYTESILSSGESLLGVINDVLDFSKIEAGELELDVHEFDLHQAIESILDVFGFQCAEKDIEICLFMDPSVPKLVSGDSVRFRQVLLNLLSNAIKFTSQGGIGISVTCSLKKEKISLYVEVKDSGIGIPKDRLEGMFDSFTQADSSISRRFGGTGLGLAICKSLVHLMGGTIGVDSEIGVGSTFRFSTSLRIAEELSYWGLPEGLQVRLSTTRSLCRETLLHQLNAWGASVEEGDLPVSFDSSSKKIHVVDTMAADLARKASVDAKLLVIAPIKGESDWSRWGEGTEVVRSPAKPNDILEGILSLIGKKSPNKRESEPIEESRSLLSFEFPLRILVAEDNVTNQKLLKLVLEREGYSDITVANNGREALSAMEAEDFDLVFMDLQMPELDGLGATVEIRKRIPIDQPPYILALTANASKKDLETSIEVGMHGFLTKPIRKKALLSSIVEAHNWLVNARKS
ncbi:ATP-binding protein [Pelagicoccus albus]|uniref:histidine kinase n=1 Tax=Pelagicoccus albus TaxID=415222 RepID=A0A7X1B6F8_9BACT|nr:ATP-binding protein [Pelagicoccus albus]MBC2606539.1 response regulator [Pelagicoccus albus]